MIITLSVAVSGALVVLKFLNHLCSATEPWEAPALTSYHRVPAEWNRGDKLKLQKHAMPHLVLIVVTSLSLPFVYRHLVTTFYGCSIVVAEQEHVRKPWCLA